MSSLPNYPASVLDFLDLVLQGVDLLRHPNRLREMFSKKCRPLGQKATSHLEVDSSPLALN